MPSLRIAKALISKGIFLLDCEIHHDSVDCAIAFFEDAIKSEKQVLFANINDRNDLITIIIPVTNISPIYQLKLRRIQ